MDDEQEGICMVESITTCQHALVCREKGNMYMAQGTQFEARQVFDSAVGISFYSQGSQFNGSPKLVLIPVHQSSHLFNFLRSIRHVTSSVICRPCCSSHSVHIDKIVFYYDLSYYINIKYTNSFLHGDIEVYQSW